MGLNLHYGLGQTSIDENERSGMLIHHIVFQHELNQHEQKNIDEAMLWLKSKDYRLEEILTENFIKLLHKKMFGKVWNWAGEFRKTEKNIGIPWIQISIDLRMLLDDTKFWIENKSFDEYEIALRFKHRIVSIHCFPNGNGRHSRVMADILVEKIFKLPSLTWGSSERIKVDELRKKYIQALIEADNGSYKRLIEFATI